MKKFFAVLICGSMFALGSCDFATGTGFSNNKPYIGFDVVLADDLDIFVPIVPMW